MPFVPWSHCAKDKRKDARKKNVLPLILPLTRPPSAAADDPGLACEDLAMRAAADRRFPALANFSGDCRQPISQYKRALNPLLNCRRKSL